MSTLTPFLVLDQPFDRVLARVNQQLTSVGLRAVQTFDLQAARLAHPHCAYPYHGTNDCNCQMVVLFMYGKQEDSATMVIHGQDDRSWVSLAVSVGETW